MRRLLHIALLILVFQAGRAFQIIWDIYKHPSKSENFVPNPYSGDQSPDLSTDAIQLLINSESFWEALSRDISNARNHVYVQTMSFEADTTGTRLTDALKKSTAQDRRMLADDYSRHFTSDHFLYLPRNWFKPELKKEVLKTEQLARELPESGVLFQWTNPVAATLHNFPARNHKKMIVIDDHIAYLGGINFCDHNFSWDDLMFRIDDPSVARFLKDDFLATWNGRNQYGVSTVSGLTFYLFDGQHNEGVFTDIVNLIRDAKRHIYVHSAYASFPFFEVLREVRQRGVDVTLMTPLENNKPEMKRYILWDALRSDIDVRLLSGGMNHLKAILIDDEILILGSCNFDFLNYTLHQEIAVVIHDPGVIREFKTRVQGPNLANSIEADPAAIEESNYFQYMLLKAGGYAAVLLNR